MWSPFRRTNAGRFEVDHPRDYATLISCHPSFGTCRPPGDYKKGNAWMILIDRALRARGEAGAPIRVALSGAGFIGRAIAYQILTAVPGMKLVAIASRNSEAGREPCVQAGADVVEVSSVAQLEAAIRRDRVVAVTHDVGVVCAAPSVDILVEATGSVEFGAETVLRAIEHRKHIVLVNVQLDATLGPILKVYADSAGILISGADGDQPGEQLNLYRLAKGMGMTPLMCGNIKGLLDHYRTPETQKDYAAQWKQNPYMVTSFADGTEVSFEQATVANATGMRVAKRGMFGIKYKGHIDDLTRMYDVPELRRLGGIVDYVVGAQPGPGVFVLAEHPDPRQQFYLESYKLGKGPLYNLYTPYHLVHLSVPFSVARLIIFHDQVVAPLGGPVVDVVAIAKRHLRAGDVLDGIGGFTAYGLCENADLVHVNGYLPMGLAEGCRLRRELCKDRVICYDDVELPPHRLSIRLRAEQDKLFFGALGTTRYGRAIC
jgi:predicted homoserine dehydrogenase-like protein